MLIFRNLDCNLQTHILLKIFIKRCFKCRYLKMHFTINENLGHVI